MNTADWVGLATLAVAGIALIRSFSNDGKHWIKELFATLNARMQTIENEHKAYKEQQDSVLRDHYLPRRDFDRHEKSQKEDFDEIKAFMRDVREKIEKLPEDLMRRLSK